LPQTEKRGLRECGGFFGIMRDLGCTYAAALDNAGEFPGGKWPSIFFLFGGPKHPYSQGMEGEGR